jgi:hypothetical protein
MMITIFRSRNPHNKFDLPLCSTIETISQCYSLFHVLVICCVIYQLENHYCHCHWYQVLHMINSKICTTKLMTYKITSLSELPVALPHLPYTPFLPQIVHLSHHPSNPHHPKTIEAPAKDVLSQSVHKKN